MSKIRSTTFARFTYKQHVDRPPKTKPFACKNTLAVIVDFQLNSCNKGSILSNNLNKLNMAESGPIGRDGVHCGYVVSCAIRFDPSKTEDFVEIDRHQGLIGLEFISIGPLSKQSC